MLGVTCAAPGDVVPRLTMKATRATARFTRATALLLELLLCAPPAMADAPNPEGHSRVTKYVVPLTMLVSLVVIGAVLVVAAFARRDDSARLRSATAKLDRALGLLGGPATGTDGYHIRSAPIGLRLALDAAPL